MERIGCTTHLGLELDNICTEQNKSLEAEQLFWEISGNTKKVDDCPYPCHFLMTRLTNMEYKEKTSQYNNNSIWLEFDKYIKVTISNYSYTGLELLAELGGYIGLFLGLSVFDLRLVFNKICNTLAPNKVSTSSTIASVLESTDPNEPADSIET